jgi:hypothetical protein
MKTKDKFISVCETLAYIVAIGGYLFVLGTMLAGGAK